MTLVFLDTNLLLLLMVGRTSSTYLAFHKRTTRFDVTDYDVIETLVSAYDGIVTSPHVLTEASNLLGQTRNPAKDRIRETLRRFILSSEERSVSSEDGCLRNDFIALVLTDAVILSICEDACGEPVTFDLLTTDAPLYNRSMSLGVRADLYA